MQVLTDQYKYLKFTSLENTVFWDFYTLSNKNIIDSKYPLVKLNQVITQRKGFITIDDSKIYKRCRVQVHAKGVVLRDEVIGKEIKTKKQQLCKTNDFLVAEIDAKVGGFGIVPEELENAIVSGHYFLFEIDTNKLLTEFLGIVVKQTHFSKQVKSTGSTNYAAIRPAHVLGYQIPLPSIEEQKELVNAYNKKVKEAQELAQQAKDLEGEIERYLFDALGYKQKTMNPVQTIGTLKIIDYLVMEKWGFDKNNYFNKLELTKSYDVKKISDICTVSSGGTPSRDRKEYYTGVIPWIKTGEVINGVIYDTEEKITEDAVANSSAKIYPKNSLIIAMYGQGLTRGRTAKLGIDASTNQACAVLFNIDSSRVLTDFLWIYLIGEYDRLREMASGNNQPNLNAQMIKNYKIIIPPILIQSEIIAKYNLFRQDKMNLISQSQLLKQQAEQDFERAIFN